MRQKNVRTLRFLISPALLPRPRRVRKTDDWTGVIHVPLSSSLSLHRDRHWKNFLLDGHRDQLGFVVNIQFAHQVELVRLHRLHADSENRRCLSYGMAFGEQLHHFALAKSEGTS